METGEKNILDNLYTRWGEEGIDGLISMVKT